MKRAKEYGSTDLEMVKCDVCFRHGDCAREAKMRKDPAVTPSCLLPKGMNAHANIAFGDVCKSSLHLDHILNFAYDLYAAKAEEAEAHKRAQAASERRMEIERRLADLVGVVADINGLARKYNAEKGGAE